MLLFVLKYMLESNPKGKMSPMLNKIIKFFFNRKNNRERQENCRVSVFIWLVT